MLGSLFTPVAPKLAESLRAGKAWCIWFNSTAGILSYLNIQQRKLTYPAFSLDGLRSLPVPAGLSEVGAWRPHSMGWLIKS